MLSGSDDDSTVAARQSSQDVLRFSREVHPEVQTMRDVSHAVSKEVEEAESEARFRMTMCEHFRH